MLGRGLRLVVGSDESFAPFGAVLKGTEQDLNARASAERREQGFEFRAIEECHGALVCLMGVGRGPSEVLTAEGAGGLEADDERRAGRQNAEQLCWAQLDRWGVAVKDRLLGDQPANEVVWVGEMANVRLLEVAVSAVRGGPLSSALHADGRLTQPVHGSGRHCSRRPAPGPLAG